MGGARLRECRHVDVDMSYVCKAPGGKNRGCTWVGLLTKQLAIMSLQAGRHGSKTCRQVLLRKDALSKGFLVMLYLLAQKTPRTRVGVYLARSCNCEPKLLRLG